MKYGILTFHNIPNTGAALQAYALCKVLRERGADCEIIDYRCDNLIKRERTFQKSGNPVKTLLLRCFLWPKQRKKIMMTDKFMRESGLVSERVYDASTRCEMNEAYDAFITGSDMIWNLRITDHDFTYFLDFADEGKKKLAYAPSVDETWEPSDLERIRLLLRRYDKIGVRETDTRDYLRNSIGIVCDCVSDPTLLLPTERWKDMAVTPDLRDYVLVYFPTVDLVSQAKRFAARHDKKVFIITTNMKLDSAVKIYPTSPAEWIGYFANAYAVFTNSYHGFLFSLYFEKPVWSGKQGSRVKSMAHMLGIENSFITDETDYDTLIDYSRCTGEIAKIREASLRFIDEMLA